MLNYLFCLDQNYNKQLLTSLNSINTHSKTKFNVFIIHNEPSSLLDLINEYNIIFDKVNNLQVFKYSQNGYVFPNLENNHISEATYYRFFIEDYIKEDLDCLIYLDCDILCLNNPEYILKETIKKLENSSFAIAASTEYVYTSETSELFNRLNLSSNNYFNAGVIVINYRLWKSQGLKQKLLNAMDEIYEKVNFWDQDILNYVLDGNYLSISNNLNFSVPVSKESSNIDLRSVIFLHFAGSNKPWSIEGILQSISSEFHKNYFSLFSSPYFVVINYRKKALFDLIKNLINLKILKLQKPFKFIIEVFKALKK